MYWSKVKTILIFFLIITNVFLLMNLYSNNKDTLFLKKDVIKSTVQVLNKNNVFIDQSIIPKRIVKLKQFEADNLIKSYDEFAKSILGKDADKISETRFESDKGYVEFSGDKFDIFINYKEKLPESKDDLEKLFESFNLNITDFEYKDGVVYKKSGKYYLYDCKISLKKDGENLKISGVWYEKNSNKIFNGDEIKPITSALIDFISDPEKPLDRCEIKNIKLGYRVYETTSYHKSIVPVPVWELELSKNQKIYINARTDS